MKHPFGLFFVVFPCILYGKCISNQTTNLLIYCKAWCSSYGGADIDSFLSFYLSTHHCPTVPSPFPLLSPTTRPPFCFWPFQEISDYDLQDLVLKSIGRLTLVRQTFPMPQNSTQRCVKHNHRINNSLCDPKNPKSHQLEVSRWDDPSFWEVSYFRMQENLFVAVYDFSFWVTRTC